MPILRDFERRLGNMVEGFFATTFRSGLQPVELAKRLMREMDAGKTVGVHEVWAPNRFVFLLSEVDAERFGSAEQVLATELKQVVRDAAAERGWGLVGPPEIVFEVDDSLGKGRFRVDASFLEGEEEIPPALPASPGASVAVLEEGRAVRTYPLGSQPMTIGRLAGCDIVISDPGVSRQHARLRPEADAWVVSDLGSTNGTLVNDVRVQERTLADGDRITIGATLLEFRRG